VTLPVHPAFEAALFVELFSPSISFSHRNAGFFICFFVCFFFSNLDLAKYWHGSVDDDVDGML